MSTLQRQVKEDIDAVIVDSVFAIRQGLRGEEGKIKSAAAETIKRKTEEVIQGASQGDTPTVMEEEVSEGTVPGGNLLSVR